MMLEYYLYYTAKDTGGGIVGAAVASSPFGPWTDLGAVYGPVPQKMFESPMVFQHQARYYLVFHQLTRGVSEGGYSVVADSPVGPWSSAYPLFPGWAHEIWRDSLGDWYVSYLTSYTVSISPLSWNDLQTPPRPFVGAEIYRLFLPTLRH